MKKLGSHEHAELVEGLDCNGRVMVRCNDCQTCAHAWKLEDAEADLAKTACSPSCQNCAALRRSYDKAPAVPEGGSCTDMLHVCPFDGNRWWQGNDHWHLWQQVTSDREWETLLSWQANPVLVDG